MMYLYQTLPDETEIVHSHLIIEDGVPKVIVHFERPTEDGFDSALKCYNKVVTEVANKI